MRASASAFEKSSGEERVMPAGRIAFLSVFFLIFIIRFAVDPFFHYLDPIDGSMQYALIKMLQEGKFLGVDSYFVFGPLAQYLGPFIEAGQKTNAVKIGFEILVILILFQIMLDLSGYFKKTGGISRLLFFVLTPVLLGAYPFLQSYKLNLYEMMIFLAYLNFYRAFDNPFQRKKYLAILLFLAVTLVQFKFSAGIHALAALAIVSLYLAFQGASRRILASVWLGWVFGSFLLFLILTNDSGFFRFFLMGLKTSSAYSEFQALNIFDSRSGLLAYPAGLLFAVSFVCLGVLLADRLLPEKFSRVFFILNTAFSAFYFFKHGFVRADAHVYDEFYLTLFPLFLLLAVMCLARFPPRRKEFWLTAAFLFIGLLSCNFFLKLHQGKDLWQTTIESAREGWVNKPRAIHRWLTRPGEVAREFEEARARMLKERYPEVGGVLERIAGENSGKKNISITFSPWALMMAATVPQYRLVFTPSVQVYSATGVPALGLLDQQFLSSPNRPDVVVLSAETSDNRVSLSEYHYWLEPLLKYYQSAGTYHGQTVFVRSEENEKNRVRCSPQGPGLFLKLQMEPMGFFKEILFELSKLLFKAPEVLVRVDMVNSQGQTEILTSRSYYSQLKEGVYYADRSAGRIIADGHLKTPAPACLWSVQKAVAFRKGGFDNIPVFPRAVPLKAEFCIPAGCSCRK